jgi:uncharacterized membrane protein YkvA (DUF1232 family)
MNWIIRWKHVVAALKRDLTALALALPDPRTPWYARALLLIVISYALSPIDLIPDFIPVLGQLDDLLLLPLGIALVIRLIPPDVLARCRHQAHQHAVVPTHWRIAGTVVVVGCWLLLAAVLLWWWFGWAG